MTKLTLGYLHSGKILTREGEFILKKAKEVDLNIVMLNISKEIDLNEIEEMKKCDVIYNNSGEEFAIEFIKFFEQIGKTVVESSKSYYADEDKWMFYLKCKENNIPTPKSILLSENLEEAKKQLIDFKNWPVILKGVRGTWGEFVEKAENLEEAIEKIKKLLEKGDKKIPILAQEFINSFSYRVTCIGNKIVQTAIKENNNWKCTGVYARNFKKFEIDPELEKIVKKIMECTDIKICGVDFLRKNDKWLVIEVNSEPALDFFENERENLVSLILDSLVDMAKKAKKQEKLNPNPIILAIQGSKKVLLDQREN